MARNALLLGLMFAAVSAGAEQSWEVISGQNACISDRRLVVVRSQTEWVSLWSKHNGGRAESVPDVDFSKEMVVAVYLGERRTSGYQVLLNVLRDPIDPRSRLTIFYREVPPPPDRATIQVITHPFTIRKIAKVADVVFEADQAVGIPEKCPGPGGGSVPGRALRLQELLSRLRRLAARPALLFP